MTILGTRPAADDLPAGAPRGREAERILAGELLAEMRHMRETMTEMAEEYAGQVVNHVLLVETIKFGGDPVFRQWHVAAGCVTVDNPGQHAVTVAAAGPSSDAPTSGVGVYVVPAGTVRTVALASRQMTLYGTAADVVSVQVLTSAVRPVV